MKGKLFKSLLESDKIEPQFTYDRSGNTALHYAVSFSHKEAIQKLLKRNSSLIVKNKLNKCVLDMIDPEDLEKHFDSCLVLDNYAPYFSDINYKMRFRFNCLVDSQEFRESRVVSMIGKQPNLERLLTHPFIHTFVTLKWF
jgi:ankyrin repeat protein